MQVELRKGWLRWSLCFFLVGLGVEGIAQESSPEEERDRKEYAPFKRDSKAVLDVFVPLVEKVASQSIYSVGCDGEWTTFGVVVDPAGYIMTKASEIEGELTVKTIEGDIYPASEICRDVHFDLALLKTEQKDLIPVEWSEESDLKPGRLIFSVGHERRPLSMGVIGVIERKISGGKGRLGFSLTSGKEPGDLVIGRISPRTPAEQIGLRTGDVLLSVDGEDVISLAELLKKTGKKKAGDEIKLVVQRDGQRLEFESMMAARTNSRRSSRRSMQGDQSALREGFPAAFQHDSIVSPESCGSVVLGIDGRALGINIARAGRTATYAIPGLEVMKVFKRLNPVSD